MNIFTYGIRSILRLAFVYTFIRGMYAVSGDISAARTKKKRASEAKEQD